jgi:thiol-disulfide isomerase/thioredoxin
MKMKRGSVLGLVVLCACALGSWAAAQDADPAAGLVDKMAARMGALKSVDISGEIVVSMELDGTERSQRVPFSMAYAAPNKLRMTGPGLDVTADGTHLYSRSPLAGEYVKARITGSLLAALGDSLAQGVHLMPDERALLSADPRAVLSDFAKGYRVTVGEDADLDGEPCWRADFVLTGIVPDMDVPIKVWIDQASGLVRQWRVDEAAVNAAIAAGNGPPPPPGISKVEIVQYGETAKVIKANEPVDESIFKFTARPGEKEVAFFTYGLPPEPEAFALSGKKAPDFEIKLLDGKTLKLSTDGKDKVVFLDFWATWCTPCRIAMPEIADLAREMKGKDVLFLGISTDDPAIEDQVRQALEEAGVEYACGIDRGGIADEYMVEALPNTVLIDRKGAVVGRYTGFGPPTVHFIRDALAKLLAGQKVETVEPEE